VTLYVLDTDIRTLIQFEHPRVMERVKAFPPDQLAVSVISVEEQLTGWYAQLRRSRRREDVARAYESLAATVNRLSGVTILGFSKSAIDRSERLIAMKLNVRKKDLCIAAIALEHNAAVVTRNVRDFQRVPALIVEDWTV
jgi:tRNA(fMet)-specific endonuclease VapC